MSTPIGGNGALPLEFQRVTRELDVRVERPDEGTSTGEASFSERLGDLVREANEAQETAEAKANDFASGRSDDIHGTMIAMQQADIQLRLLGSVRNKIIEAYREVMRMGA